jgi:hypothetical protein
MEDSALRVLCVPRKGERKSDSPWDSQGRAEFTLLLQSIELVAEDKDRMLEKGEHIFAFSMIVPSASGELGSDSTLRLLRTDRCSTSHPRCILNLSLFVNLDSLS